MGKSHTRNAAQVRNSRATQALSDERLQIPAARRIMTQIDSVTIPSAGMSVYAKHCLRASHIIS
jgi:predicted protein tyrosine phosphatase